MNSEKKRPVGRPKKEHPKVLLHLSLDRHVYDHIKKIADSTFSGNISMAARMCIYWGLEKEA
jgi:hypothetical protein